MMETVFCLVLGLFDGRFCPQSSRAAVLGSSPSARIGKKWSPAASDWSDWRPRLKTPEATDWRANLDDADDDAAYWDDYDIAAFDAWGGKDDDDNLWDDDDNVWWRRGPGAQDDEGGDLWDGDDSFGQYRVNCPNREMASFSRPGSRLRGL
jgi:hypothetical protein